MLRPSWSTSGGQSEGGDSVVVVDGLDMVVEGMEVELERALELDAGDICFLLRALHSAIDVQERHLEWIEYSYSMAR